MDVYSSYELQENGTSFRLFATGSPFVRNSWQPYFYGSLTDGGTRTLIRGQFRMHPAVLVLTILCLMVFIVIGGVITLGGGLGSAGGWGRANDNASKHSSNQLWRLNGRGDR